MGQRFIALVCLASLVAMAPGFVFARESDGPCHSSEIFLDARAGVTLQQLLSKLEADVEWGNHLLGEEVIQGSYCGSKEAVAQALLSKFNYVILRGRARLRVIVMNRISPASTMKTGETSLRPPQSGAEKIAAEAARRADRAFGFGD